jgi:hypothetical protein
LLLIWV